MIERRDVAVIGAGVTGLACAYALRKAGRDAVVLESRDRVGGIFAGDANEISIRAAFPQFVEAEKKHGSLMTAMRAAAAARAADASTNGAPASTFTSLERGIGGFPAALARTVGDDRIRIMSE